MQEQRAPARAAWTEVPLSDEQFVALQRACGPAHLLSFPPTDIIRSLRQHGYVQIVLGGIQITPQGLERLEYERTMRRHRPTL